MRERVPEILRRAKGLAGAAAGAVRSRAGRGARRSIAAGSAGRAARGRGDGTLGGTPVFFVVGQQKSGTTWLMRMLDAHPEILCRGEGRFFGEWRQKSLVRSDATRPPSSLSYALRDAEYLRLWIERSVWGRGDDADEHLDNVMRMAVDYFLRGELAKSGKRLVGDKSPLLAPETVAEISAVYPEARVIHIIRDGRDAAVSAAHHARNFGRAGRDTGGGLFDEARLRKLAADWNERVGKAVLDGPRLFGDRYAEVRYEDLLVRPEAEVGRLLRFLGAASDAGSAGRCVRAASFEKLSRGRSRGEEDPSSFFRKGVAGDWREALTERDRRVFDEEAGGLLRELGYGQEAGGSGRG